MSGPTEWEVTASKESIALLFHALDADLREGGFRRLKISQLEGKPVSQYFRGEDVIAVRSQCAPNGARLVVEAETLDVYPIVEKAIARSAAGLLLELLSGQSARSKRVSAAKVQSELEGVLRRTTP